MTEKDTIRIVTLICMSYPSSERLGENAIKGMVNIWKTLFADDPAELVELAVTRHIATSKWPPSVAEIRELMAQMQNPELIPPELAWVAVRDVMAKCGEYMHRDLREIFPPLIARTVETIGWHALWISSQDKFTGQRFFDVYTPMYQRELQKAMLPASVRASIARQEELYGSMDKLLAPAREMRDDAVAMAKKLFFDPFKDNSLEEGEETPLLTV